MIHIPRLDVRIFLIYVFTIVFLNNLTAGEQAVIKGKVYDGKTHEPLLGVNVIFGTNKGTITDESGNFLFETDSGLIHITFTCIGYKKLIRSVYVAESDTSVLNIGMNVNINELEEIVVSANKTEQKISDLTVTMNVIKPEIISTTHTITTEEIVNKTPGIEIMDGQASIRGGSGYSYGAGSRVLALIDGLPVLSADAGNIKWHFFSLENLSQLEIIKGASSVLYGSSALNGIINLRTMDATTIPFTRISVLGGVYDKTGNKEWIWWDSPRFFSNVSVFHSKRNGNTGINAGGSIYLDQGYRRLNDKKYGRFNFKLKQYNGKVNGLSYGVSFNSVCIEKRDFILWEDADSGALKQDISTAIELNSVLFTIDPFIKYNINDRFEHEILTRFQTTIQDYPENTQNNSDSYNLYTEYRLLYRFLDLYDLTFGISENYSRIFSNFYNNHYGINLAGYLQASFSPLKEITIISGMRLEQNILDKQYDDPVPIFRAGINIEAAEYTFIRCSFGQGYRYPSIAEKFAYTELGAVKILPNPDLESESGWSGEVGLKQGIRIKKINGQLDLSAFILKNRNMIEYDFGLYTDPYTQEFGFGFKSQNIENARVYGSEIEFVLKRDLNKLSTRLQGGYTFIYPIESDNDNNEVEFLKYRSHHSAKLLLNLNYGKFDAGLNSVYKSKILEIDNVFTSALTRENILPGFYRYWRQNNNGYIVFDLQLSYLLAEELKISFAVKNFTNTEYMSRPGDIQPQRNYSLQLSMKL